MMKRLFTLLALFILSLFSPILADEEIAVSPELEQEAPDLESELVPRGHDGTPQARPPNLTTLENTPSAFVNGMVNVITGEWVERQVDVHVNGPDPLVIERTYSSLDSEPGNLSACWSLNFFGSFFLYDDDTT